MDDEQKAEKDVAEESNVTESPTVEPKDLPEAEEPETEPSKEEAKEEQPKAEESPKLKPVEKRIHKLVGERDKVKAEKESLAKQVEDLTSELSQGQAPQDYSPTIEPGTEVSQEQYKADVVKTAQSIAQLEVRKQNVINTINKEANESMQEFPELDPKSDVFDTELSESITDSVKAQIQVNPSASVKKLVTRLMKPYKSSIKRQVAESTETIAKQVSESAQRPSQVKGQEKSFDDLSIEEMEQKLGVVN